MSIYTKEIQTFSLTFYSAFDILTFAWGIGAVGSALEWHSRGHGFKSHMLHYLQKPLKQRFFCISQCLCGFEAIPHSITIYQSLPHFVPHFKNLCHICATFKAQKAPISQSGSFFAKNRLFLQIVYKIYRLFIFQQPCSNQLGSQLHRSLQAF